MSISKKKIAVVLNLSKGGGPIFAKHVIQEFQKKYLVDIYSPKSFSPNTKNRFLKFFKYLYYIYFYLKSYYLNLGRHISKNNYFKIVIFQDLYIKTPPIFQTLTNKNIYILHEPPREFYENIFLHTNSISQIIFTYIFRFPIYFFDRKNMRRVISVVSNSKYSKNLISRIYKKNSQVIYPGFRFTSTKTINRQNQCLSMGGLFGYKGHEFVIRSLGLIKENRPNLVIVGNGTDEQKSFLKNLANRLSVHLKIVSNLTDNQLSKLYSSSSIYVNGAQNEPFGMTSLEAVGHGCHLVTNKTGGTKEIKEFFNDRVTICDNNVNDMALAIKSCLGITHSTNPDMEFFSWKSVSHKIESL